MGLEYKTVVYKKSRDHTACPKQPLANRETSMATAAANLNNHFKTTQEVFAQLLQKKKESNVILPAGWDSQESNPLFEGVRKCGDNAVKKSI